MELLIANQKTMINVNYSTPSLIIHSDIFTKYLPSKSPQKNKKKKQKKAAIMMFDGEYPTYKKNLAKISKFTSPLYSITPVAWRYVQVTKVLEETECTGVLNELFTSSSESREQDDKQYLSGITVSNMKLVVKKPVRVLAWIEMLSNLQALRPPESFKFSGLLHNCTTVCLRRRNRDSSSILHRVKLMINLERLIVKGSYEQKYYDAEQSLTVALKGTLSTQIEDKESEEGVTITASQIKNPISIVTQDNICSITPRGDKDELAISELCICLRNDDDLSSRLTKLFQQIVHIPAPLVDFLSIARFNTNSDIEVHVRLKQTINYTFGGWSENEIVFEITESPAVTIAGVYYTLNKIVYINSKFSALVSNGIETLNILFQSDRIQYTAPLSNKSIAWIWKRHSGKSEEELSQYLERAMVKVDLDHVITETLGVDIECVLLKSQFVVNTFKTNFHLDRGFTQLYSHIVVSGVEIQMDTRADPPVTTEPTFTTQFGSISFPYYGTDQLDTNLFEFVLRHFRLNGASSVLWELMQSVVFRPKEWSCHVDRVRNTLELRSIAKRLGVTARLTTLELLRFNYMGADCSLTDTSLGEAGLTLATQCRFSDIEIVSTN